MCVPLLGAVFGMMGSVMSAAGSAQAAQGQADQANYNAAVEEGNKHAAYREGVVKGDQMASKYDKKFGEQRAAFAKAGVNPHSGSALRIWEETSGDLYMDVANTEHEANSRATAHGNKAADYRMQAANYEKAAKTSFLTGIVGGLGGLAKGGGAGSSLSLTS
jgi:hypothetical protein